MSEVHVLNLLRILSALLIAAMPLASALAMQATPATAPVLLLSDIHLDPFHDPAKFPALLAASPAGWATIFDASSSPTQATDFDKLQAACGSKGVDTPIALLESALKAAHAQQPAPLFITVSGDLMAHQFDCRFHTLHPAGTPAEYSAFAAKTVAFVALQLHLIFPRTPIYLTLGNNDSGCKDYNEDPNSAFLQADGKSFAADSQATPPRSPRSFPRLATTTSPCPSRTPACSPCRTSSNPKSTPPAKANPQQAKSTQPPCRSAGCASSSPPPAPPTTTSG
jgi:sphingomyelin phosphodiesterase acid-like 3